MKKTCINDKGTDKRERRSKSKSRPKTRIRRMRKNRTRIGTPPRRGPTMCSREVGTIQTRTPRRKRCQQTKREDEIDRFRQGLVQGFSRSRTRLFIVPLSSGTQSISSAPFHPIDQGRKNALSSCDCAWPFSAVLQTVQCTADRRSVVLFFFFFWFVLRAPTLFLPVLCLFFAPIPHQP